MSSRPAAIATWETARGEGGRVDHPRGGRHRRQRRIVLDRHQRQREPRAAAADRDLGSVHREVHGVRRQRPADLGQQPAADQRPAGDRGVHLDLDLGRDLVVEAGDGQRAVGDLQQDPAEDRNRRAGRQAACGPRDRIGERVTLNPELHRPHSSIAVPAPAGPVLWGPIMPGSATAVGTTRNDGRSGVVPNSAAHTLLLFFALWREGTAVVVGAVDPVDEQRPPRPLPQWRCGPAVCGRCRDRSDRWTTVGCPRSSTGRPPVVHRVVHTLCTSERLDTARAQVTDEPAA